MLITIKIKAGDDTIGLKEQIAMALESVPQIEDIHFLDLWETTMMMEDK